MDLPTRVAGLIGVPLVWIAVARVDPAAIGLTLRLTASDWALVGVLALGAALVTLAYRRWYWPVGQAPGRTALVLELPFFLAVNPVAEELFFRGGVQFGLANWVGMPWSIAITSVVFGFHHGLLPRWFPFSFLIVGSLGGALFGIVAAMYQSIAPAIVLHAAADLVIFVAAGPALERLQVGLRAPAHSR
ncbi:MAG: CPBP family intramembrane metalloprotease [Actinobacteria bacterium]|nr:CPBP family intramembrane metalloprotease [Actinomycetota bacterium]